MKAEELKSIFDLISEKYEVCFPEVASNSYVLFHELIFLLALIQDISIKFPEKKLVFEYLSKEVENLIETL